MTTTSLKVLFAAAFALTVGLSGCSSDDDDPVAAAPTPTTPAPPPPAPPPAAAAVPDSAGASVSAFISYLMSLASTETGEPLVIGTAFTVPPDEGSEPQVLN